MTFGIVSLASLLLLLFNPQCEAQPAGHEVTSLPGWNKPLPSRHFSGYLPVGTTSGVKGHIHYWYIEAETNPETAPVVYWTNGGPGGSGISTGLLTEMGQFQLDADSIDPSDNSTVPKLQYNPYGWSKVANTVFVSQPKGVGFSYCDDASKTSDCVNNDVTAAEDAYDFFVAFFDAYPHLKKNDFYLTAESYGGIYIPMFMDQIQKRGGVPNLKGAAIGDGCWGTSVGTCAFTTGKSQQIQVEFFNGHGMFDQPLYSKIKEACKNFTDEEVTMPACKASLKEMTDKIGTFDVYNVYDTCAGDTLASIRTAMMQQEVTVEGIQAGEEQEQHDAHPQLGGAVNDYGCGRGRAASMWLAREDVQHALHVKAGTPGMKYNWGPFNVSGDLRPLYKELASKYRMLIYSGDTDACVPYWGTEEWTRELGFPIKRDWHPWLSPLNTGGVPQRAGYVVDYESPGDTHFKFATVSGAGHMVPTYKPGFALTLIDKFLKDEEL